MQLRASLASLSAHGGPHAIPARLTVLEMPEYPAFLKQIQSCTESAKHCDAHLLRPNRGATEPMMPILTAMRPISSDSTMFHSCSSRLTSMLAPVVTKNSPSSIPRNGLMSASTCTCQNMLSLPSVSWQHLQQTDSPMPGHQSSQNRAQLL